MTPLIASNLRDSDIARRFGLCGRISKFSILYRRSLYRLNETVSDLAPDNKRWMALKAFNQRPETSSH